MKKNNGDKTAAAPKKKPRGGRNKIVPSVGAATQFTKDKQPSGESKSNGWKKKLRGKELALAILDMPVGGMLAEKKEKVFAFFGFDPKDTVTLEEMIYLNKMFIAMNNRGAGLQLMAGESILNRAHGLPKQTSDVNVFQPTITATVQDNETKEAIDGLK